MIALRSNVFRLALTLAPVFAVVPAEARVGSAQARLRDCGGQTCLVIDSRRRDSRAIVSVAGRPVAVQGGRAFRIALPLDTVRDWSAPFARSIALRVDEPGGRGSEQSVRLPIGLLGNTTQLAAVEVSAR